MKDNQRDIVLQLEEVGELGGLDQGAIAQAAEEEYAMLAEVLPVSAPNDLYLVSSPPILREVRRKLIERF